MLNSTRNRNLKISSAEAIISGIASDGGLYVPNNFPNKYDLVGSNLTYPELCNEILKTYFVDLDFGFEIKNAYQKFSNNRIAPVVKVGTDYVLELFHGPTAAFKDFALQVLPILLKKSKEKVGNNNRTLILTATSGDTGKAALDGFANENGIDTGIDIAVIYPSEGVSKIQKKQMMTQKGKNVLVMGINGNFDDAQKAVKEAFLNKEFISELKNYNIELSSANSINIGRLIPQISYYFYAYNQMLENNEISKGEKISFSVPTGNFGDILAGYYAKMMGLPVDKLVCASNDNKILTDFFNSGTYDRRRELIKTNSPSMDIIVSSNLERFLYHIIGSDVHTKKYMDDLSGKGHYKLEEEHYELVKNAGIIAGYSDEEDSYKIIKEIFDNHGYVMDTHTAIAWKVAKDNDIKSKLVVLSTASAYKFSESVCDALEIKYKDDINSLYNLSEKTDTNIPTQIESIVEKKEIHNRVIETDEFLENILSFVKNRKVNIKVPATSANLGAGFDVMGISLELFANISVDLENLSNKNLRENINLTFENVDKEFANKENLVYTSYLFAAKEIDAKIYPANMNIKIESDIPISRGLGSSASLVVAGVVLAYEIEKKPYTREDILLIANKIEGHPDNVAPAIFGGLRVSMQRDENVISLDAKIYDDLNFVAIIPDYRFSTEVARKSLPKTIDFKDAIFNISSVATLLTCLQNRDYKNLKFALEDKLHQQYRIPHMEGVSEIFEMSKEFLGCYVSGAGPTIMVINDDGDDVVKKFEKFKYKAYKLNIDFNGTTIM